MRHICELSLALLLVIPASSPGLEPTTRPRSNLEILDAQFEPIGPGKNVLYVKVRNTTPREQAFAIHIQTRSGMGWGRPFFDTLKSSETKRVRFPFKIHTPITDGTWIRVQYYNPASVDAYDFDHWFLRVKYAGSDLEHRSDAIATDPSRQVLQAHREMIIDTFRDFQNHIRDQKQEKAWHLFTRDLHEVEFFEGCRGVDAFERFKEAMGTPSWAHWSKTELLSLEPKSVAKRDGVVILTATYREQPWTIDFVQVEGVWKIDWIGGYAVSLDWKGRLLAQMQKRSTEHFDIHYFEDSTAAKEIDRIAEQKEDGFRKICRFLGRDSDLRICVVLFEDGRTKQRVTGHRGAGWAFGQTIVEVYNKEEKVDPHHETMHILMGRLFGSPPALFNEGFAVYMQVGHVWQNEHVDTIAARLARDGKLEPLNRLIARTEIGSRSDDGKIAYPESASFVKFLIDKFGKDKFLQVYQALRNSNDRTVQRKNMEILKQAYGKVLFELERDWVGELLQRE